MKDVEIFEHPSFGIVGFSRIDGHTRLFSSDLLHGNFIQLEIKTAKLHRHLCQDQIYSKNKIIEVWLSEAQFVSLISTMNVGDGVPCTIKWEPTNGEVDEPPIKESESETSRHEFKEWFSGIEKELREAASQMQMILDSGKAPTKMQTKELIRLTVNIAKVFKNNAVFANDQFSRAVEKTVSHAKAEIEAFVNNYAHRTGIEQLKSNPVKQLSNEDL